MVPTTYPDGVMLMELTLGGVLAARVPAWVCEVLKVAEPAQSLKDNMAFIVLLPCA